MTRAFLLLLAAILVLCASGGGSACTTQTCESSCDDQLDDCLARAPPGAAKQDCFEQHSSCLEACSASAY